MTALDVPSIEPSRKRGSKAFFLVGLALTGVNLIWITMLAISVLRLIDNPLYAQSMAIVGGIALVALILRILRFTTLANVVIGLQPVISAALLINGLDGVAY